MNTKHIKNKIETLPMTSGVYLMKDAKGSIIYVGKAVNIRKRVQSYFRKKQDAYSKTDKLVENIAGIDHIDTNSEAEALILEASLIKKFAPKYNIDLRDDKSYPLIEITAEDFPKVSVQRPKKKKKDAVYFGPYVNAGLIREALILIRKIFKFRTCDKLPKKECLDCHIGLCVAPCIGKIGKRDYKNIIKSVCLILDGKKDELYRRLKKRMDALSSKKAYEEAAIVRDQLRAIGALYSGTKDVNYFKEAEQLQRLLGLSRMPERIEAFDISNIMGQQAVGSMVSFINGKPDKRNYRRFKIKEVEGINDFKMMAEVVGRRYSRLKKEHLVYPDLIVIDGGKGQLSAACRKLKELDIVINIISLAKREEEIFMPNKRNSLRMTKDSLGLQLLQRIRNEAHRFAITYHRKLRSKEVNK